MTVPVFAALLGRVEVRPQLLRVVLPEPERAQPREPFLRPHCAS